MFRRVRLPLFVAVALLSVSCASDTVSFDGERAVDAAATPTELGTDAAEPTAIPAPTDVPIEPTATVEAAAAEEPAAEPAAEEPAVDPGLAAETVDAFLPQLESPGGMVFVGDERECVRAALVGSVPTDPGIDTGVLNCLDDDGVHRWVSSFLGAQAGSGRAVIDPSESTCVWEQADGQVFSLYRPSAPAIQQCGVWGRVNLSSIDALSDDTLRCLDVQMQTTRLPNGDDRAAVDERVGQCATPDELAIWNTL